MARIVPKKPTCQHAIDACTYPVPPMCVGDKGWTSWMCRCALTGKVILDAEYCKGTDNCFYLKHENKEVSND